jgi:asparagine synthase (glutamine-hydrolysing)
MCGIWLSIGPPPPHGLITESLLALKARGPEGSAYMEVANVTLGFTRLAINGLSTAGMQPMSRNGVHWICNGEIYNWRALAAEYGIECTSGSDCEIIGPLYERFMELEIPITGFFRALDGVFALAIVDEERDQIIVGRDPYGVRPLYACVSTNRIFYASEIKALPQGDIFPVFPGSYQVLKLSTSMLDTITNYHTVPFYKQPILSSVGFACMAVRATLEAAVKKRMMTERPVAALLSGGLDSSLIAALIAKELRVAGAPPLRTYSIGMPGSSDLAHAKMVAKWIGSKHTEVVLDAKDFLAAIPEVVRTIESYDTTTVRASVGNWLVAKAIKDSECKVVFNGDGADEVWGSYLYFYGAPSDGAYEEEVTRLLQDIHYFDVLRSDRCVSSHGLEPRTPYLDREFVAMARSVPTELRRPSKDRCEKWLMRTAFDDGTLPREVLWRRKEAFSDGVSGERSWFQIIQEDAAKIMGDWEDPESTTAEQAYYRKIYKEVYGAGVNVPYKWMPRWSNTTDPSARTLGIY